MDAFLRRTNLDRSASELRKRQATRKAIETSIPDPLIVNTSETLTAHAAQLLKHQYSLSLKGYNVERREGASSYFVTLERRAHTQRAHNRTSELECSEEFYVPSHVLEADKVSSVGADETHWTTSTACSCLFQWNHGLPCRHILAVMKHEQQVEFQPGVIDPLW
mmetsp:Transcript_10472/g.21527  ORF Transcript_10472/g.21527 Transcript_10472/m.21527 type:complete len:164 (-) Transcript_10472:362-853(-)